MELSSLSYYKANNNRSVVIQESYTPKIARANVTNPNSEHRSADNELYDKISV